MAMAVLTQHTGACSAEAVACAITQRYGRCSAKCLRKGLSRCVSAGNAVQTRDGSFALSAARRRKLWRRIKRNQVHTRKKLTAYNCFVQEQIKSRRKDGEAVTQLMSEIARDWMALGEEDRVPYAQLAEVANATRSQPPRAGS